MTMQNFDHDLTIAEQNSLVTDTEFRKEQMQAELETAFSLFRHLPSACNWNLLTDRMLRYQKVTQEVWDERERAAQEEA